MKLKFLLFICVLSAKLTAQIEDLIKNKNITWIAESYIDFMTEQAHQDSIGKRLTRVTRLKFLNPTEKYFDDDFVFQNIFIDAVKSGKVAIFKDENCKTPTFYNEIKNLDTLPNYNNEVKLAINPRNIFIFRARQIIFYDSSKVQFGLRTLAIAPMRKYRNEKGIIVSNEPWFWIKVTDLAKKRNLNDADITWAQIMGVNNGVLNHELLDKDYFDYQNRTNPTKFLKRSNDTMPIWHFTNALGNRPNIPFHKVNDQNILTELSAKERFDLTTHIDTITQIIDTITKEKRQFIVINKLNPDDLKRLGLIQNWYWNSKKNRLEIKLVASFLITDVHDDAGNFIFTRPYFYKQVDD